MKKTNVLYQHGTLALLVPGLLEGTTTMGDLLTHGDTGIGTGEGLDGELIILDGVPYQADSRGNINKISNDFTMPFSNAHFADYRESGMIENLSMSDTFKKIDDIAKAPNTFFSIKLVGEFESVKTRAVAKSNRPYHSLVKSSELQSVFDSQSVFGTLLSYYSPELFNGAAVGGYHSHFLADDHSIGGHVLDFKVKSAKLYLQIFDTLEQHLPVDNQEYMNYDFKDEDVDGSIETAEK